MEHSDFLLQELLRWERIGCTTMVKGRPRIVLPISVVFSNKWRLVCDASRHINPYVVKNKVSLDSLSSVEHSSRPGDFMSKQDLSSGYFHVMLRHFPFSLVLECFVTLGRESGRSDWSI